MVYILGKGCYSPCISLGGEELSSVRRLREVGRYASQVQWVELRFDLFMSTRSACDCNAAGRVRALSGFKHRVAVCHRAAGVNASERQRVLSEMVVAGCDAVDIDWREEQDYSSDFYTMLSRRKVKRIRSLHLSVPLASSLAVRELIKRMRRGNPYLVKIVVPCCSTTQLRTLLSCYDGKNDLLLIASGRLGRASRALATSYGAPYSYVYLEKPTGRGQFSLAQYSRIFSNEE